MNKRKRVVWLLALLFLAALGYLGYRTFVGEADGTIAPAITNPTPESTVSQRLPIEDQYVRFTYPAKFVRVGSEAVALPVLARYNFTKRQVSSWQAAITINRLQSGSLADDGTYNYRSVLTSRYAKESRTIGDKQIEVFTDTSSDVFNKVAYLRSGTLGASISLYGGLPSNKEQLQTDFDAIIASWQWR